MSETAPTLGRPHWGWWLLVAAAALFLAAHQLGPSGSEPDVNVEGPPPACADFDLEDTYSIPQIKSAGRGLQIPLRKDCSFALFVEAALGTYPAVVFADGMSPGEDKIEVAPGHPDIVLIWGRGPSRYVRAIPTEEE